MINLSEYLIDVEYNRLVNEEYFNLTSNDIINESFQASILTALAKRIKDAEKEHAERDKIQRERNKEQGYSLDYMAKSAKSFASIFGPITETPRWGDKKTGIRGLKWSEIKDDDFQYFEADSDEWNKKFIKLLKSVYNKKIMADIICCKPGTKEVVNFIKGYVKTLGEVRVYYFPTTGWKKGVQEKTATKYKYGERSLKFDETIDTISGLDIYFLEIKDDMVKTYDELHQDREESRKGSIELDDASMAALLKKQQSRYNVMVKEIKAKKLQKNPNDLFDEIKQTNDDVVALFKKVMDNPKYMDMRFDLSDLMRYVSYAYEQFYKSMKSTADANKFEKAYREKHKNDNTSVPDFTRSYEREQAQEYIRDAKDYLTKVKKGIKEIEDQLN